MGYRGRPLNVMVDEVVANGLAAHGKYVASKGTDCLRVRSTESEPGEETERSSKTP